MLDAASVDGHCDQLVTMACQGAPLLELWCGGLFLNDPALGGLLIAELAWRAAAPFRAMLRDLPAGVDVGIEFGFVSTKDGTRVDQPEPFIVAAGQLVACAARAHDRHALQVLTRFIRHHRDQVPLLLAKLAIETHRVTHAGRECV